MYRWIAENRCYEIIYFVLDIFHRGFIFDAADVNNGSLHLKEYMTFCALLYACWIFNVIVASRYLAFFIYCIPNIVPNITSHFQKKKTSKKALYFMGISTKRKKNHLVGFFACFQNNEKKNVLKGWWYHSSQMTKEHWRAIYTLKK